MGNISAGGTATHKITIYLDPSEEAADVGVEVYGFGQDLQKSYITLDQAHDDKPNSARSYITLDNSTVHLKPGDRQVVNAKISIPSNVGSGGRYALIYVHALPGKGKTVTTAILIPVMITISGTTPTETGSITDLSVGDVILGQPITITTTLKNTGNYHYYHTINVVEIHDNNGKIIENYSTEPSMSAIIPGNTVTYMATPELQNLPVGSYTADSKICLENGKVLDEKTTTFTVKKNYIPPLTESNITLIPGSTGTLTSSDGRYSISFPQGAVLGDAVVTLKPYQKDKLQKAPTNAKLGATSFEITGLTGLLNKEATVHVKYSDDDLAVAGGDASQLKLAYFDAAQSVWVILPTQVDTGTSTLTTSTNHLSVWAVMASSSTTGSQSSASASSNTPTNSTPVSLITLLASLAFAVIAAGYYSRNRK
jgi:hypothetical protein